MKWHGKPALGAEDLAEVKGGTPGTMVSLGVAGPEGGQPRHSSTVRPDEACMAVGVEVLSASLLRWIEARG